LPDLLDAHSTDRPRARLASSPHCVRDNRVRKHCACLPAGCLLKKQLSVAADQKLSRDITTRMLNRPS